MNQTPFTSNGLRDERPAGDQRPYSGEKWRNKMPNYISNTLTVTGPNPAAVIAATTTKFTETEDAYKFEETGPDVSYYSDYAVHQLDPTFDREQAIAVAPDEQTLKVTEDKVVVTFESKWVAPWAGVARLSRLFPENTLRLSSHGEFSEYVRVTLYSYKAGVETALDPREEWPSEIQELVEKYQVTVTSDKGHGDGTTGGTIVIDGVTQDWTFSKEKLSDIHNVAIPGVTLTEIRQNEVYQAVTAVLWTFPYTKAAVAGK